MNSNVPCKCVFPVLKKKKCGNAMENRDEKGINVCKYKYTVLFSFRLCYSPQHFLLAVRFCRMLTV